MKPRQRIAKVLNHEIPDKVPLDFGATPQTGIAASMVYKIKKHYGLLAPEERIK